LQRSVEIEKKHRLFSGAQRRFDFAIDLLDDRRVGCADGRPREEWDRDEQKKKRIEALLFSSESAGRELNESSSRASSRAAAQSRVFAVTCGPSVIGSRDQYTEMTLFTFASQTTRKVDLSPRWIAVVLVRDGTPWNSEAVRFIQEEFHGPYQYDE
jgi:hypothetical protein